MGGFPNDISERMGDQRREGRRVDQAQLGQAAAVDRVWLFDRPNTLDQITAGTLEFSDGSTIKLEKPLPDTATSGLEISFSPKTVSWVKLTITGVKEGSPNIGLAEFGVFGTSSIDGYSSVRQTPSF